MTNKQSGFLAAALLCAGTIHLPAQTNAQTPPPQSAELTGLAHVAFRVSDLDREVNFFGKMGFEEAFADVTNGRTLQVYIKVNDLQYIEVYPRMDPSQPLGFMHACFESPNLDALRARYVAEGLRPTPVLKAGAGDLQFTLLDPDSRVTEFAEYMPGSRHMDDSGRHLGVRRVSDELMGFELPVTDMNAAQKFYEKLGFDAQKDGASVRLTLPADPDLRVELHPESANGQPQFLFSVDDAHRAADELHSAGLKVVRNQKLVFLHDPDGNQFVLLETGTHSPRHLLPWHK